MTVSLPSGRPPRILITRTDRIGDLVLSTPAFAAVRKRYPKSRIACLTFAENQDIVRGNPYLDEVILYRKKDREKGWLGNLRFARSLAQKKFDAVVHLHATSRMHWVTWLAQIPVRIGYRRKNPWTLTHAIADDKKQGTRHESEYNFDLLKFLDVPCPENLETHFPLNERAGNSLEQLLKHHEIPSGKPWVVLNPSASCPSKRWPAQRFAELCGLIAQRFHVTFLLIGAAHDRPVAEKFKEEVSVPVYDLTGRLSLAELGHLLRASALLISNDSGPVHIAAALGTPVISIFGRNQAGLSPARWKPLGAKTRIVHKDVGCTVCLAHQCQINFLCLDAISAEEVYELVQEFSGSLEQRTPSHAVSA